MLLEGLVHIEKNLFIRRFLLAVSFLALICGLSLSAGCGSADTIAGDQTITITTDPVLTEWVTDTKRDTTSYVSDNSKVKGKVVSAPVSPSGDWEQSRLYWLDNEGNLVKNQIITEDQAGYLAYATEDGSFAQGAYLAQNGIVYLADERGKLASSGWLTSDEYGQGSQLYYIDEEAHGAIPGFSDEGGRHYTALTGVVARGGFSVNGQRYFADEKGIVATSQWITTGDFTDGTPHLYYATADGSLLSTPGFTQIADKTYYITPDGYVLTGKFATDQGTIVAMADGTTADNYVNEGWITTSTFDGTTQTYYFEKNNGHLYAKAGFFTASLDDARHQFYSDPTKGYIVKGRLATDNGLIVTDSQGILADEYAKTGWYEGADFDKIAQRYYFEEIDGHLYAATGWLDVGGSSYYAFEDKGYLSRNGMIEANRTYYSSDSEGRLTETQDTTGSRDETIANVSWINNPYYLEKLAKIAAEQGSKTDYCLVADYELCRLVVFQRTSTLTADSGYEDLADYEKAVPDKDDTSYGFITVTNANSTTGWTAIKAYNGNFGASSFAGTHEVCHKKDGNVISNSIILESGEENPSAYSTCYLESWADSDPGFDWQDPDTGLWHDCAAIHGTNLTDTGYDQRGCLALLRQNAKWIWERIPIDTTVYIF